MVITFEYVNKYVYRPEIQGSTCRPQLIKLLNENIILSVYIPQSSKIKGTGVPEARLSPKMKKE